MTWISVIVSSRSLCLQFLSSSVVSFTVQSEYSQNSIWPCPFHVYVSLIPLHPSAASMLVQPRPLCPSAPPFFLLLYWSCKLSNLDQSSHPLFLLLHLGYWKNSCNCVDFFLYKFVFPNLRWAFKTGQPLLLIILSDYSKALSLPSNLFHFVLFCSCPQMSG